MHEKPVLLCRKELQHLAEIDSMANVQLMDLPGTALQQLLLSVPAPIAFMLATTCRRFHEELRHNRKVLCVVFACLLQWYGTSVACQRMSVSMTGNPA